MRKKIATGISVLSFGLIYFGLSAVAGFLGELAYIDFGETIIVTHEYYEEEIDVSGFTGIGQSIIIMSIMFAWRIYRWIISGKVAGNLSKERHTTWLFWLLGISFFTLISTLIQKIEMYYILENIIILGCAIGIARFVVNKYDSIFR